MCRISFFFIIYFLATKSLLAQVDTLSNLSDSVMLYAPEYDNTTQWGYILGQNSSYRQQFAEKYIIEGPAKVKGLITHLTGTISNPENFVEFNIYEVASNGLPGSRIGGKQLFYKDLDLSGEEMTVNFSAPITVADSFFVTFNVLDYLHGGYEGDTLGLLAGEPGAREQSDLQNFGRNAIQAHNHTKEDWKDFYTQNFTPIATHFALFPIVEYSGTITNIEDPFISKNQLKLYPPYPNPAEEKFNLRYSLYKTADVSLQIYDMYGKQLYDKNFGMQASGEHIEPVDINSFPAGTYIYMIRSGMGKLAGKLFIK